MARDGRSGRPRPTASTALAVGPDGTVWVVVEDEDKYCPDIEGGDCPGTVLMRLEDDGSLTTIEDWADVYDGDAAWYQLAVSPDGDVWLVGTPRWDPEGPSCCCASMARDGKPSRVPRDGTPRCGPVTSTSVRTARCG